jgi:hypothetical protein
VIGRRLAVFLVAALALLGAAQEAPAGILGLQVSLAPGQRAASAADEGALQLEIAAPVVEVALRASPAGASASLATPLLAADVGTTTRPPKMSVNVGPGPRADRRPPAREAPQGATVARRPVVELAPTASTAAAPTPPPLVTRSAEQPPTAPAPPLPEQAPAGWNNLLSAAQATASGASAALAGLVLIALSLLVVTLRGPAPRLTAPLLSFALQRPG